MPSTKTWPELGRRRPAASLRGDEAVRSFCRLQRQALLAEARTLQTLRRERNDDPGAAFTIEVAILRTNAELECVEAAEARAGQRLVAVSDAAEQRPERSAAADDEAPIPLRRAGRGRR